MNKKGRDMDGTDLAGPRSSPRGVFHEDKQTLRSAMQKHQVRTPAEALVYITDCNLATVASLAMKKFPPKGELARQISIAQLAIDWMRSFEADFSKTRASEVVDRFGGKVEAWAETYFPKQ